MTKKKEGHCSRCGAKLPLNWTFKECKKCHERTLRRFPKIRSYKPKEFRIEYLGEFMSFEQFVQLNKRHFKGKLTKERKEKLRTEYDFRKKDWNIQHEKEIQKMERDYHVRKYPVHCLRCLEVREQALKHYMHGEPWDTCGIHNHIIKCDDCNLFIIALKNGEFLEESPVETKPEEGYSSLEEWKNNMDAFGEATRSRDPIDEAEARNHPKLRDVHLNNDKPSEPQQPRDPYLEELREKQRQQQQPQKPEGFLDRLRKRRDQNP
jgi:ribosomal protein L40E